MERSNSSNTTTQDKNKQTRDFIWKMKKNVEVIPAYKINPPWKDKQQHMQVEHDKP